FPFECAVGTILILDRQVVPKSPADYADENSHGVSLEATRARGRGDEVPEVCFAMWEPLLSRRLRIESFQPGEPLEIFDPDLPQCRLLKNFPPVCRANTSF